MKKHQKYKANKKVSSIVTLQQNLFDQLDDMNSNDYPHHDSDLLFNQFEQCTGLSNQRNQHDVRLLTKAKQLTYSNKGKIQRMRKEIKRMQEGESGDFVTGVGLFQSVQPQQNFQILDEDLMLRNISSAKHDDLQELRKMIKKTESNLRNYSQSVYHTQKQVVSAADRCGKDLDIGLAIKINKCNLDSAYSMKTPIKQQLKRRTISSQFSRKKKE